MLACLVVMWIACFSLILGVVWEETDFNIYYQIDAEAQKLKMLKVISALKRSDHYHDYDDEAKDDQGDKSVLEGPDELATGEEDWLKGYLIAYNTIYDTLF